MPALQDAVRAVNVQPEDEAMAEQKMLHIHLEDVNAILMPAMDRVRTILERLVEIIDGS